MSSTAQILATSLLCTVRVASFLSLGRYFVSVPDVTSGVTISKGKNDAVSSVVLFVEKRIPFPKLPLLSHCSDLVHIPYSNHWQMGMGPPWWEFIPEVMNVVHVGELANKA